MSQGSVTRLVGSATAALAVVALALPAAAPAASGETRLALDGPAANALRAQGVRVGPIKPASGGSRKIVLPVAAGIAGSRTTLVRNRGGIALESPGGEVARLTSLRLLLGNRTLVEARLGGEDIDLFEVLPGGRRQIDAAGGRVRLANLRLKLTPAARKALTRRLGLGQLPAKRFGSLSTSLSGLARGEGDKEGGSSPGSGGSAQESAACPLPSSAGPPAEGTPPTAIRPPAAVDVTSAAIGWHVRESFIRYIASGEGTSVSGGATADPPVLLPGASAPLSYDFRFPFANGWLDTGANPASPADDTAALYFSGAVRFHYSGHGIDLVTGSPEIELGGGASRAIFSISDNGGAPERQVPRQPRPRPRRGDLAERQLLHLRARARRDPLRHRLLGLRRLLRTGNRFRMLQRLLLHLLIAMAAAASLSLASPWASAANADAAQVTVVSPGGTAQTLALGALAGSEDVSGRTYAVRSADGESEQAVTGFSLAAILDAAGADPYSFSYLEVQRPAGGTVQLSRDQALDPGAFANGPPVVYATPTGTAFLRPSSGPDDLNATDCFEAPQGITIALHKGTPLQVKARASTPWTRPGQPVRFTAIVKRAGAGEHLTYSWYFDDGHSATGSEATHSFAKRGSYNVVVGVTTDGNETGASAVVTVQVGAPIDGPNRKGGGTKRDADAPDHGAATGSAPGAGGPAVPPTDFVESRTGRAPTDTQRGRRPRVRRGMTGSAPTKATQEPAPGERVVGELLSSSGNVTPTEPAKQAAARRGDLSGDGSDGGLPTAAWGLVATLGLLGMGALIEAGSAARLLPTRGRAA